jgi:aspartate kinase
MALLLVLILTSPTPSLLEVFKRLQGIAAATSNESAQNELIEEAKRIVDDICVDHVAAADTSIRDEALRATIICDIESECRTLVEYLEVAKRFNLEINSRAKDRVVSFGEKLSCRFMACLLKDRVRLL